MKIIIKIQSFGDIITNSSSETFCTITGSDVNKILEILKPLFCEFHYCDMYPTVEYYEKGEYTDDSPALVAVSLPQGFDKCKVLSLLCSIVKQDACSLIDKERRNTSCHISDTCYRCNCRLWKHITDS